MSRDFCLCTKKRRPLDTYNVSSDVDALKEVARVAARLFVVGEWPTLCAVFSSSTACSRFSSRLAFVWGAPPCFTHHEAYRQALK